ncbi:MAG: hypothetical protein LBL62_03890 [Planctomycetaceae bacterium]|jgi:hypothetical protein|nr:hypothetical protein [Planctomycetaceae bacterium]
MKFILNIFLVSLCVLLSGCGNGYISFGGKITFEEDGSPLTLGTVVFTTDTFQAEGMIHSDGTYQLGSLSQKDGLPPGNYKVFVTGAGNIVNEKFISLIDLTFTDRNTTPLLCEVTSGKHTFDFTVKKVTAKP